MNIDITSFFFNSKIEDATATCAWGTSIGQSKTKECRIESDTYGVTDLLTGMVYKSKTDRDNFDLSKGSKNRDYLIYSVFDKVFVNGMRIENKSFIVLLSREQSQSHAGRLIVSYPPYATYRTDEMTIKNEETISSMFEALDCNRNGCWFAYAIDVQNQDELHFSCVVVNKEHEMVYRGKSAERSATWASLIPDINISKKILSSVRDNQPRQIIYYGAPGTGKSYKVKEKAKNDNSIRTTFHPDSDYSTFVGAYKPTMGKKPLYGLFGDKTIRYNDKGDLSEDTISYKFIPQAFMKAYCEAWRRWNEGNEKPYYLVIEEINRGNCAQIFGDLFQLLDRDPLTGYSTYAIEADDDVRRFISEEPEGKLIQVEGTVINDIVDKDGDTIATGEDIAKGKKLVLPPNLYIWATMNTSDQSLFPIDSAFKRRWDWEYRPIEYKNDKWYIEIGDVKYSWVSFQRIINKEIFEENDSEDKKLGDYFVVAKGDNIPEDTFKNKVLFYLWNDVFKDGESDVFKIDDKEKFSFSDFYDKTCGRQNLLNFMDKLGVKKL